MEELPDKSWQIDSAFEAQAVSASIAYVLQKRFRVAHEGMSMLGRNNESGFFRREQLYGSLILASDKARIAEKGLHALADPQTVVPIRREQTTNPLNDTEALFMLRALAVSRGHTEAVERLNLQLNIPTPDTPREATAN